MVRKCARPPVFGTFMTTESPMRSAWATQDVIQLTLKQELKQPVNWEIRAVAKIHIAA